MKLLKAFFKKIIETLAKIEQKFDKRCAELKNEGYDVESLVNRGPTA